MIGLIGEKTKIRVIAYNGMLIGFVTGSIFGFLESLFVTLTGFNIPLVYSTFVYGFDLLGAAVIGALLGSVFAIILRFKPSFLTKFDIDIGFALLVLFGIVYLQGLVFLLSKVYNSPFFYLIAIFAWLFINIILFLFLYYFLKRTTKTESMFLNVSPILSAIIILQTLLTIGVYLNTEFFHSFFQFKSIAGNTILILLSIPAYLLFNGVLSRFAKLSVPSIHSLTRGVLLTIFIGLVISIASWPLIQPRFPVLKDTEGTYANIDIAKTQGEKRPNIILISIDTLRADHLGAYGYPRSITPHIDRLSREGTMFRFAISQSPWTLPSHASIMTSLYPSQHGANQPTTKLARSFLTLAEVLEKESYITAAFTGGGWVSSGLGFDQGFHLYDDKAEHNLNLAYEPIPFLIKFPLFTEKISFSYSVTKITNWLRKNTNKRFFLFIHTFEVHNYFYNDVKLKPYLNKLGFQYDKTKNYITKGEYRKANNLIRWMLNANERDIQYMVALYDVEIMYTDELLNKLFKELKSLGIYDNTLIILTSDHGEGFNKKMKRIHHGGRLHNDQVLVPLIFRLPGVIPANKVIKNHVRLIDVFPTIHAFLQLPKPQQSQGKSLLDLIFQNGLEENQAVFSEELGYRFNKENLRVAIKGSYRMVSVFLDGMKFIHSPDGDELYDFERDPGETKNLVNEEQPLACLLKNKIKDFIQTNKPKYSVLSGIEEKDSSLSKETQDKLRSLGYLR